MSDRLVKSLRAKFPMYPPHPGYSALQIMHTYGSARNALLYAALFVPELIEIDGSVFLNTGEPDFAADMKRGVAKWNKPREELEELVSMAEVHYLFTDRRVDAEETDLLTEFIAQAWRGQLALQFPGRKFRVWIDPEEISGDVPVVRFCEIR